MADDKVIVIHGAARHYEGYEDCWWNPLSDGCDALDQFQHFGVQWNRDYQTDNPNACCELNAFPEGWINVRRDDAEKDVIKFLLDPGFTEYAIDKCAEEIRSRAREGDVHVIGHSLGTTVALRTLHRLRGEGIRAKTFVTIGSGLSWLITRTVLFWTDGLEPGSLTLLRRPPVDKWINIMDTGDWVYKHNEKKVSQFYYFEEWDDDVLDGELQDGCGCNNLEWPKKDDKEPIDCEVLRLDISFEEMCTHLSYFHPSSKTKEIICTQLGRQ